MNSKVNIYFVGGEELELEMTGDPTELFGFQDIEWVLVNQDGVKYIVKPEQVRCVSLEPIEREKKASE